MPEGLGPGDQAPNFTANRITGESVTRASQVQLEAFSGKIVLLNFWASWCAPCLIELESLQQLHSSYQDKGFIVVAVALDDTVSAVNKVMQEYKLTFPVLLDNSGRIKMRYQITGFPETLLLDRRGRITMINDEKSGLVNKIRGERNWNSDYNRRLVTDLLSSE